MIAIRTGLLALASVMVWATVALAAEPTTRPVAGGLGAAKKPAAATKPVEAEDARFPKPTPEEVQIARLKADLWGEKTYQTINGNMHRIKETEHFWIYSTWDRSNDAGLREACEGMYAALCRQFGFKPSENIWVGKCPVYVFGDDNDFRRFTATVDEANQPTAGGYTGNDETGFVHIVLANRPTKALFLSALVHEGTHAFLMRYRGPKALPTWLQEGLAEYMAAELVPAGAERKRYVDATRDALRRKVDVTYIFKGVPTDEFNYGVAQSLVRYLIARDPKAFVQMVDLIKQGEEPELSLATAYDLSYERLLMEWYRASAQALGIR